MHTNTTGDLEEERDFLPCPFCGSAGLVFYKHLYPAGMWFSISCRSCGLETDDFETEKEATEYWNKRP